MKTWFWILGWSLSALTLSGNGFIIFLVCSKRQLRTKTNAFIVSLAVADFCVGMTAVSSLFFCHMSTGCNSEDPVIYIVRNLFAYASVMNLCSLVLDRYIAVVKPLKYLTFMERRRVIQMVSLSWAIPVAHRAVYGLDTFILKTTFLIPVLVYLTVVFFEFLPCAMLIFCFVSMLHVICKRNRTLRSLAKHARFNQQVFFKTQEKSAVIMMGIVISLFLLCYGIYLRCSIVLIIFGDHKLCNDYEFKIPILVLNSAVNPLAYSFFKRDTNKEIKGRICCARLIKRTYYCK